MTERVCPDCHTKDGHRDRCPYPQSFLGSVERLNDAVKALGRALWDSLPGRARR